MKLGRVTSDAESGSCSLLLQVKHTSFSLHTDSKGIVDLVQQTQPQHVVLVHGEEDKMAFLQEHIASRLHVPCFMPANFQPLQLRTVAEIELEVSDAAMRKAQAAGGNAALQRPWQVRSAVSSSCHECCNECCAARSCQHRILCYTLRMLQIVECRTYGSLAPWC